MYLYQDASIIFYDEMKYSHFSHQAVARLPSSDCNYDRLLEHGYFSFKCHFGTQQELILTRMGVRMSSI